MDQPPPCGLLQTSGHKVVDTVIFRLPRRGGEGGRSEKGCQRHTNVSNAFLSGRFPQPIQRRPTHFRLHTFSITGLMTSQRQLVGRWKCLAKPGGADGTRGKINRATGCWAQQMSHFHFLGILLARDSLTRQPNMVALFPIRVI